MVVLTSSLSDPDWPDSVDRETGVFTYYGDNKKPGRALHETPRNGNELLRRVFDFAQQGSTGRRRIPLVFVFANTGVWRDVVFLGLAAPGTAGLGASEDLVAIWKISDGKRFQNYRARFTILDVPVVPRAWLSDIVNRQPLSVNAPSAWLEWVASGQRRALVAKRSLAHRTKSEQLPHDKEGLAIIRTIHRCFSGRPHDFELCAAALAKLLMPDIASLDVTRPSRDGGRDAIGLLRVGRGATSIVVDFALEAKCYGLANGVGVREMSRLISRLRHRHFGVLVTTSYVDLQTYKEIKDDNHPIVVVAASDIVELLRANELGNVKAVENWLSREFSS
jgi:hypothetical protein